MSLIAQKCEKGNVPNCTNFLNPHTIMYTFLNLVDTSFMCERGIFL